MRIDNPSPKSTGGHMKPLFAMLALALALPLAEASPPNAPAAGRTIKLRWLIKTPASTIENAKVVRGSRDLPLSVSPDCAARFKVDSLSYTFDGNMQRVNRFLAGIDSMSDLKVVIIKQFAGRGEPP